MTNWEKAQKRAEEIDEQILNVLRSGKSFRVEAGAGAGKTYSLEKVVQCISDEQREEFARNEQYVACITYTNVAAEVIRKRLPENSFVRPSTIHAFAWSLMNQFQAALISLVEKLELSKTYNEKNILEPKIQRVVYSQGIRYVDEGTLFLSHNDVIDLFALILDKQKWNRFGRDLEKARKKVIYDVINIVADSGLLDVPPKIKAYKEQYEDGVNTEYGEKTLKEFYEIPYEEVVKAIEFFAPESMFSTDHGVKGEQYENVLLVLGRGWSNYKFDETLYKVEESMSEAEKKKYVRNRNLFYVCCSRAEKRLAILITTSTNEQFKEYLERIFGADVILEYGSFMEE